MVTFDGRDSSILFGCYQLHVLGYLLGGSVGLPFVAATLMTIYPHEDSIKWKRFIISLTQVLANQPMIDPTEEIKEFRYHTQDNNHLLLTIDFKDGRGSITMIIAKNIL